MEAAQFPLPGQGTHPAAPVLADNGSQVAPALENCPLLKIKLFSLKIQDVWTTLYIPTTELAVRLQMKPGCNFGNISRAVWNSPIPWHKVFKI